MRYSGKIYFFDSQDHLLLLKEYHSREERKRIMKYFENQQHEGYIQIAPQALVIRQDKVREDVPKEKLVRFPAVYDNDNRSLYK